MKHDHIQLTSFYHSPDRASYLDFLLARSENNLTRATVEWVRSKTANAEEDEEHEHIPQEEPDNITADRVEENRIQEPAELNQTPVPQPRKSTI